MSEEQKKPSLETLLNDEKPFTKKQVVSLRDVQRVSAEMQQYAKKYGVQYSTDLVANFLLLLESQSRGKQTAEGLCAEILAQLPKARRELAALQHRAGPLKK